MLLKHTQGQFKWLSLWHVGSIISFDIYLFCVCVLGGGWREHLYHRVEGAPVPPYGGSTRTSMWREHLCHCVEGAPISPCEGSTHATVWREHLCHLVEHPYHHVEGAPMPSYHLVEGAPLLPCGGNTFITMWREHPCHHTTMWREHPCHLVEGAPMPPCSRRG